MDLVDAVDDPDLPGLQVRPLVPEDAAAVYALMAASEKAITGEVHIELADIVGDWQRPSFDLATQSIGVLEHGELIGYAEVASGRRADAAVHPDHLGRGIGTALALWTQRVSVRDGAGLVGMPVPDGAPGERLLESLGYQVLWTSWVLELPEGEAIVAQPLPDGYVVRTASEDERVAVHDVLEDAFLEWAQRERESYEDFLAETVDRPGFAPWNLRVVADPDGAVVAAAVVILSDADADADADGEGDGRSVGYVDRIAVRRDRRGLGLARALLADSFAVARAHGASRSELSTDSRTGALGLYERVGMRVTSVWRHWAHQS